MTDMPNNQFTWIPLYKELATKLLGWENRQSELIALIEAMRADDFIVTTMADRDANDNPFLMKEIDPFTFFGVFNRGITNEGRIEILTRLKEFFSCTSDVPSDFDGIPLVNNMKSWFVGFSYRRKSDDVTRLWNVFRLAQGTDPIQDPEFANAYDAAMEVFNVSNNLTMGLFWIRPELFISMEAKNREYLKLPANVSRTAKSYLAALAKVKSAHTESFAQISHNAHLQSIGGPPVPPPTPPVPTDQTYWFVGAYWKSRDPSDQSARFLMDHIWQNGYPDKYLDHVKSMKVGDRIAIKSAHTQKNNLPFDAKGNTVSKMLIRAVGTITANPSDGRTVEVAWDEEWVPKDWYFFTYQATIWKLRLDENYQYKEYAERLIRFAFNNTPQDINWFLKRWYAEPEVPVLPGDEIDPAPKPYSIDDIIAGGAFVPLKDLEVMLSRLREKKNLILQGPPGVGKTFLAERLAFALLEETASDRIKMVQFHQSYSYDDFVRGYRPQQDQAGHFGLQNGVFFNFCEKARQDPDRDYVFVIDEINRGNLSQIFGELLMLIEADKRKSKFGMPLLYPYPNEPNFFVPDNLYIIGMMNLADRSLALVDYAVRRRFAFATLRSRFDSAEFRAWLTLRQMKPQLVDLIVHRLSSLNKQICDDEMLGPNYEVGHSFFCPNGDDLSGCDRGWYEAIVETEIVPMLKEYWFDNTSKVAEATEQLLAP